ncbi:hypothetical protein AJ79_08217 [Helicocarpus griseus UAMH5409]|uniref:Uncharacterized protein n=1 Tax=Helicocarpus griseus UAMH5409 TaxID=1447875 RepID=A0A2B7WM57_9EURO|nr:hypothetical protein AJ79_08217 [Helicocarpus griseus UAMH5409]
MTWSTLPTNITTSIDGPPNGGLPPSTLAPPAPDYHQPVANPDGNLTMEPRWNPVATTTYTYTANGPMVEQMGEPRIALPSCPAAQANWLGQGQIYYTIPQSQVFKPEQMVFSSMVVTGPQLAASQTAAAAPGTLPGPGHVYAGTPGSVAFFRTNDRGDLLVSIVGTPTAPPANTPSPPAPQTPQPQPFSQSHVYPPEKR